VYMDCTTAVSNAGNISWIERSMGSLPGSSAIVPVVVVALPVCSVLLLWGLARPGLRERL